MSRIISGAHNVRMHAECFAPIATPKARILILGSIPGQKSLRDQQYYAHPRNAFWPIMHDLLNLDIPLDYPQRLAALNNYGIALWDVVQHCHRPGSMDASINDDSVQANDFQTFLLNHPAISAIFFNGAKAEQLFNKLVKQKLALTQPLAFHRMPSTSPANARLRLEQKQEAWRLILDYL